MLTFNLKSFSIDIVRMKQYTNIYPSSHAE